MCGSRDTSRVAIAVDVIDVPWIDDHLRPPAIGVGHSLVCNDLKPGWCRLW